jgi:multidrug efflux pump
VSLENIGRTLETMLGSRRVTTYVDRGQEYRVILQGREQDRATPTDLSNLYVRSETSGKLIPLANLVTLEETAGPRELNRFERLRSITISGDLEGGYPLGKALDELEAIARDVLPPSARLSWDGESREFKEAGSSLYWTFLVALIIVYLVLAAQFESFRHPFIIMMSVPLALAGALGGLWLFDQSINVYSQIGVILLIGLAAKNGVLIVEFANQLRDKGEEFNEAIVKAAAIRLRPVLMTSTCTIIGALPLVVASGAGAESRIPIGIVVMFGVTISTVLTLFVVPTFYQLMARNTKSPEHVSRLINRLRQTVAGKNETAAP